MLTQALLKLMKHESLSISETQSALQEVLEKKNPLATASFLTLLRAKGETVDELYAFIKVFKEHMIGLDFDNVFDIVGTGGDGKQTVNISTAAALVLSGLGVRVLKHGNRSVSSLSGSADFIEALGINPEMSPQKIKDSLHKANFGFAYAPLFHPIFKTLSSLRKKLGVPTTLNLLGPLLNPAQAKCMMVGVYDEKILTLYAKTIQRLGCKKGLIFHGQGLDEVSSLGPIQIIEVDNETLQPFLLDPKEYGFNYSSLKELQGGDAKDNVQRILEAFEGKKGGLRDTLILNVGLGLYTTGHARTIEEGIEEAKHSLHLGITTINNLKKNILQDLLDNKHREVQQLKKLSFAPFKKRKKSFQQTLSKNGLSIIAEIKRRSPIKGFIGEISDPVKLAQSYVEGGADAVSILTDEKGFGGSKEEFSSIARIFADTDIVLLRKDFIIDPIQVAESAALGADAILLIVSVLQEKTKDFLKLCEKYSLEALVEVHTEKELSIAIEAGAQIIGINNRNLTDFQIDLSHSKNLLKKMPKNVIKISESGIKCPQDARNMRKTGFDGVLIGESLVKCDSPKLFIQGAKDES